MTITNTMASSSNGNDQSPPLSSRKTSSKVSEHRRVTKPIMEKRRRARINQCLNEIKKLILDALHKDPSRHSKLEKADILEMTVRHLQNVQRQQMASAIASDPTVINKYRAGFNECAHEVNRYVSRIDGVDHGLRQRLNAHLNTCITSVNTAAMSVAANCTPNPYARIAFPGMIQSSSPSPLHVQIPFPSLPYIGNNQSSAISGDINNNHSSMSALSGLVSLDSKSNISTPPASASSTSSSHFNFPIPLVNNSIPSPHIKLPSNRIPLWNRSSTIGSPIGERSNSPVSTDGSEQFSPSVSDRENDAEVASVNVQKDDDDIDDDDQNDECVWRPW